MPIKRNVYIQSVKDHTVKQAGAVVKRLAPERRQYETVDEMLASIKARQSKVEEVREARYTLADGVATFRTLWGRHFTEQYPAHIPDLILPTRHVPRIKRQLIVPLQGAGITVSDFLSFLFEQWGMCRHNRAFHKFKHYPEAPALEWLLKYSALYLRIHQHVRMGFTAEDREVEKPKVEPKEDKAKLRRVVQAAQSAISAKDREIAQLRAENKRLQSKKPRRITRGTATTGKQLPDW